jgi:hypothetical protein
VRSQGLKFRSSHLILNFSYFLFSVDVLFATEVSPEKDDEIVMAGHDARLGLPSVASIRPSSSLHHFQPDNVFTDKGGIAVKPRFLYRKRHAPASD